MSKFPNMKDSFAKIPDDIRNLVQDTIDVFAQLEADKELKYTWRAISSLADDTILAAAWVKDKADDAYEYWDTVYETEPIKEELAETKTNN